MRSHLAAGLWLLGTGAWLSSSTAGASTPQPSVQQQFDKLLRNCERDPAYRVGGAAIGECLDTLTAARDAQIAQQLHALMENRCANVVGTMSSAQQTWQDYRHSQCGLYQQLFDNTPMYLNGAVCRLRLTLQREQELQQLTALQPSLHAPCK